MKKLRIGRRRAQVRESSPLELALASGVEDGRWQTPDRFNFTRDVVEVLGRDLRRRALTFVGPDGIIEPRTFHELSEGAHRWASILRGHEVRPGDRVLVLSGATVDWVELVLGCLKIGAVVVPSPPDLPASALEARFAVTGASLIIAGEESKAEIAQMSFAPEVGHLFDGRRRRASDVVDAEPTEDTSSREVAFVAWTAGTTGNPKPVGHTHGATYAARCPAEHWLGATAGDVVWCTAVPGSLQALSTTVFGAWARGAEVALHEGVFDPVERLELLHRFDVTIVCQTPAEYRSLAGRRELGRYRSRRLRRLVSTGDDLDPEVIEAFEQAWGTTIRNGYGQAETNVVVAHGPEDDSPPASLGRALPGHDVAVVDDQGNELPHGIEGSLAVRGRPPTLFAGYWDLPDETRDVFRGDWYLTGDLAAADEDGNLWFVSRAEDVITSRGRTFGPIEVERVLRGHDVVRDSAVVGIRDLERGGHFVRAFVVLEPRAEASEQLEAELRQFVAESLVEQQVPREIEFIDTLPVTSSGSIMRGELRERTVAGRPLWELPAFEAEGREVATETTPPVAETTPTPFTDGAFVIAQPAAEAAAEALSLHEAAVDAVRTPLPEPSGVPPLEEVAPPAPVEAPPQPPHEPPSAADAPPPEVEPTLEPVALAPDRAVPPEPDRPPVQEVVEPTPVSEAMPEPLHEHEHEPDPEPVPEPEPELEPPVLEAELEARRQFEPEPEKRAEQEAEWQESEKQAEPEPAPVVEGGSIEVAWEPAPAPTPPPEPAPLPAEERQPEPGARPLEPVRALEPVIQPEDEPLPDFVVDPSRPPERTPAPPVHEPSPPPEEAEADLGPLPEYIVDPDRRLQPVAGAAPEPTPTAQDPESPSAPSFPSAPVLDLSAQATRREDEAQPAQPASPRQRPAPPPSAPTRGGSAAEPGDEAAETSWMRGLSSRLSAYSLDESAAVEREPEEADDSADADET